jgi:glucose-6-phosphate-specific signal transduction histidine kinase
MERFLSRFLPDAPQHPIWARFLLTLALVALTHAVQLAFYQELQDYPLILYIPAIFLASAIFDRGSGFLATFASAVIATYSRQPTVTMIPLLIFVATGLTIAAVTETFRQTTERLAKSKAHVDALLQDLRHRTKNDLGTVISILRLQARTVADAEAQAALAAAISRIEVVARVHESLHNTSSNHTIGLDSYVEGLCQSLADLHRGVRPIAVRVKCDDILVDSSQAAVVGLIVNELVTNAFKFHRRSSWDC